LTVVVSLSSARILSTNQKTAKQYKCYHWTAEDYETINFGGWKVENERRMCEDHYQFVFTQGRDWKAPGCGTCWCCQLDTSQDCPQICTLDYTPVCGTDGNTYSNACSLKGASCNPGRNGLKVAHLGECVEETTETAQEVLKGEGERCGSCYCPPTYTAGECAPGLECKHDPMIPDAAGECVRPGQASECQDEKTWCTLTTIDCRLTTVAQKCQKTCNAC